MSDCVVDAEHYTLQLKAFGEEGELKFFLNNDFFFQYLELMEIPNSVPYFNLIITFNNDCKSEVFKIKEFEYTYKSKIRDGLHYTCRLGIDEVKIALGSRQAEFLGWMIPQDAFRISRSRYLGNSVVSAIKKLIPQSDGKTFEAEDASFDIFQINEPDVSLGLKLCNYLSTTPFWYVGRTGIQLTASKKSLADLDLPADFQLQLETLYLRSHPAYDSWKTDNSQFAYKSRKPDPDPDVAKTLVSALGTPSLYDVFSNEYKMSTRYMDYKEFWASGLLVYNQLSFPGEFSVPIGTEITNTEYLYPGISGWVIGSCYYAYSIATGKPSVRTQVQMIGKQDSVDK